MKKYLFSIIIGLSFWQNPVVLSQARNTISVEATHLQVDTTSFSTPDVTAEKWYQRKSFKTLAVPSVLIGYGIASFGNRGFPYSSQEAFVDRNRYFANFHTHIDDVTWAVPVVAVYGLNTIGVRGKHAFADRSALYLLSATLANSVTLALKTNTNRVRPDLSTDNSFPSGHTANAFVAAEFLHQEYKEESIWYSVAGYSVATATGAMRMLNNRHWLTDVFVGAGIGMLSTKVMYLVYPLIAQKVGRGKRNNVGIIPAYNGQTFGLVMVCFIN